MQKIKDFVNANFTQVVTEDIDKPLNYVWFTLIFKFEGLSVLLSR